MDMFGSGYDEMYEVEPCIGCQSSEWQMAGMPVAGMFNNTLDDTVVANLIKLGFTFDEVCVFNDINMQFGSVTQQKLLNYGVGYPEAQRIKYMSDIIYGKVTVNDIDELIKHLKKMRLSTKKIGIGDLEASSVEKMPRRCIIAGLPGGTPFVLFNSGKNRKQFDVVDVTGSRITIKTDIIPKLPYKDSKELYRLLDIRKNRMKYFRSLDEISKAYKEDDISYKIDKVAEILQSNGKQVLVKIHRDYARLLGRFIVVGGIRYPEKHLGLIKMVTLGGCKVYVYAKQADYGEKIKYSGSSERIYGYGFNYNELNALLLEEASAVYRKVEGVYTEFEPATVEFESLESYENRNLTDDIESDSSTETNTEL